MVKLRVWSGKEEEGPNKGLKTMFVECEMFDADILDVIDSSELFTKDYEAVYLGAGRVDLRHVSPMHLNHFIKLCKKNHVKITIETSTQLSYYATIAVDFKGVDFVLTQDLPKEALKFYDNIYIKVEAGNHVELTKLRNSYITNTGTLKEGLYAGNDVLLYDNNKEKS